MRSIIWALTGLFLAIVLSFSEVSPCAADDRGSPKDPAPVPAEQSSRSMPKKWPVARACSFSPGTGGSYFTQPGSGKLCGEPSRDLRRGRNADPRPTRVQKSRRPPIWSFAFGLERRMADRKQQTEIEILRLQLVRAHAEGRNEDASRIEVGHQENPRAHAHRPHHREAHSRISLRRGNHAKSRENVYAQPTSSLSLLLLHRGHAGRALRPSHGSVRRLGS